MPVARGDRAVVGAAGDGDGAVVLLPGVDPVRGLVVGGEVIELPGRLVVPAAPGRAAIDGDDGALVGAGDHALRRFRVDPQVVVIVATGRALDDVAMGAALVTAMDRSTHREHGVRIVRHHRQPREITVDQFAVVIDVQPVRAGIVRAIQPAIFFGIDHGVQACALRRVRRGEADATEAATWKTAPSEARPVLAAIDGLVDAAFRPAIRGEVAHPRVVAHLPGRGEHHIRILRIDGDVDRAGIGADEQRLAPGLAAIAGGEHATFVVGPEHVAECGHEHMLGILRIDPD